MTHTCWFCEGIPLPGWREDYNLTKCASCGAKIVTVNNNDPMNDAMMICTQCEVEVIGS